MAAPRKHRLLGRAAGCAITCECRGSLESEEQSAARRHLLCRSVSPYCSVRAITGLTAENVLAVETLLPQVREPLEMAHLPFEVDKVKLEAVPDSVYVAGVWTDHVPAVSRPPVAG